MLRILDITAPDINNGNGLRVTIWFAGCKHHCKGCHNSWTWNYDQGVNLFSKNIEETLNDPYTNEVFNKLHHWLDKDYIEGVTLSGGDPLCQDDEALSILIGLLAFIKQTWPSKTIWCYTGYIYEELNEKQKEVLKYCDVLVDGPYIEEKRDIAHTPFRGSTNQRIIKLK